MSIVVFWLEKDKDSAIPVACFKNFDEKELLKALSACEDLRNQKDRPWITISHVVMQPEMTAMIGKPGVDTIANGKTPDGVEYSWIKRRSLELRPGAK